MRRVAVTLLSVLPFLILDNLATMLEDAPVSDDVIRASLRDYHENDVFKQRLNLAPHGGLTIVIEDVPSNFWFIVLQVHTFQYNATLAYDKTLLDKVSNGSLFGSNIGLYLNTRNVTIPMQLFLKHDNVHNLDALLVIIPYGRNAPIPGGCNMEFEIEVAPYQKLHAGSEMIMVDTQPASAVLAANGSAFSCEKNPVRHKMYRLYLSRWDYSSETYFQAINNMLTAQDIVRNGVEIPPALTSSSMRRVYSAYIGTGSIYAVVATYGDYSSAYVPTFTYACSPLLYPESCQNLNDWFSKVISALILFIGFFSIIKGHVWDSFDRSLASCMMGGFVGYTIAVDLSNYGSAINVLIGSVLAILTACASIYLSNQVRERLLYKLLCNLPLGFLCGCIIYLYSPAIYSLENDWLFWLTFLSFMLIVATFFMMIPYIGEVIARAIFGTYFLIIALDYYFGTNLKYITITLIRRITVSGFNLAYVYPPHQGSDIALIVIWIMLIIARLIAIGCNNAGGSSVNEEAQPWHIPHRRTPTRWQGRPRWHGRRRYRPRYFYT